MNNLLLVLLSTSYDRDQVIASLENDGKIETWFYSFPNTFFVKTNLAPVEMSKYIESKFGIHLNFVTTIESDYFGRMQQGQWQYFKKIKF